MAEAFIAGSWANINTEDDTIVSDIPGALIRVYNNTTCDSIEVQFTYKGNDSSFSDSSKNNGTPAEMAAGYGTYIITSTFKEADTEFTFSQEVEIDTLRIYEIHIDSFLKIYGVAVASDGTVSYTDNAETDGLQPLSVDQSTGECEYGSWQNIITDFIGCKPCLFKNGEVQCYLNPNNYNQKLNDDGTVNTTETVDLVNSDGSGADVMVEFKRTWYKFTADSDGSLTFRGANYPAEDFVSNAFYSIDTDENEEDGYTRKTKPYMYYGAYDGVHITESNGNYTLHSNSGYTSSDTVINGYTDNADSYADYFRSAANKNGNNYHIEDWIRRSYILGLLMLVTRSSDIKSVICPYFGGPTTNNPTGLLNDKKLFSKSISSTEYQYSSTKVFGIENFFGNHYSIIDGFRFNNSTGGENPNLYFVDRTPYGSNRNFDYNLGYIPKGNCDNTNSYNLNYITSFRAVYNGASILPSGAQMISDYENENKPLWIYSSTIQAQYGHNNISENGDFNCEGYYNTYHVYNASDIGGNGAFSLGSKVDDVFCKCDRDVNNDGIDKIPRNRIAARLIYC